MARFRKLKGLRPVKVDPLINSYYRYLRTLVVALTRIASKELDEKTIEHIHASLTHTDKVDAIDPLNLVVKNIRLKFGRILSTANTRKTLTDLDKRIQKTSEQSVNITAKALLGFDPQLKDPDLRKLSTKFSSYNAKLIRSIDKEFLDALTKTVRKAVREGARVETLTKIIQERFLAKSGSAPPNLEARAKLIARDQVLKYNAALTRERHKANGITHYIWRTAKDERVRSSHKALEGQVFAYDGTTPVGVHPGEDYQCRCHAEPVIDDLLST